MSSSCEDSNAQVERTLKLLATLSYRHGSFDRYLDDIARAVSDLLGVDWAVVTLKLEQDQERVLASTLDCFDQDAIYSYHGSVSRTVVQSGEPLVVEDTYATPQFGQAPAGYRAYLGVPLKNANNEIIGTICTFHHSVRRFTESDTRVASLFAERAAIAIDNYQLYQRQLKFSEHLEEEVEKRTTALKSAQAKLLQQERLAAIGEFASGIVHEIRSPLSTLSMVLDYLQTRQLESGAIKRLTLAQQERARLERLLNDILTYAKPMVLSRQPLDIGKLLMEVVEPLQEADSCKIEIIDKTSMSAINADADRMKQMLYNLLKNACEATPTQAAPVRVSLREDEPSDSLEMAIRNEGDPIAEKTISRIMEPFFSTKPNGTGLGLAIVNRIVDAHNGHLKIESSQEAGTRILVSLPISNKKH